MDKTIQAYSKIIPGYVTQQMLLSRDKKFACIEQFFTPTNDAKRTDEDGNPVQVDTSLEIPQDTDMEQPKLKLDFEEWFEANKHNESVQRLFRGVIEENPDCTLTFRRWAKRYYDESVNV